MSIDGLLQSLFDCRILQKQTLQELWSGYGKIVRYQLDGKIPSVIVKEINLSQPKANHPKGWNTSTSHLRKLKSYQVEAEWYRIFAPKLEESLRIAKCYHLEIDDENIIIVLEDLDASTYNLRKSELNFEQIKLCLNWLANLHSQFMNTKTNQLWPIGTYWHLDTRADEWSRMEEGWLKTAAKEIDAKLNAAQFKTLVHGDAKVANFCFSETLKDVAAVDFQYIGIGCGMKDVAYLMSSCLTSEKCFQLEDKILDYYFKALGRACKFDVKSIEKEWRMLYPYAWADFARFLLGWAPDHYKLNEYSLSKVEEIKKLII